MADVGCNDSGWQVVARIPLVHSRRVGTAHQSGGIGFMGRNCLANSRPGDSSTGYLARLRPVAHGYGHSSILSV
jgi:hypothetical protein